MAESSDQRPDLGQLAHAARCGAKTRKGTPCRAPAVAGKRRCRMHGGARGTDAPQGNRNALKSGLYTREMISWRRDVTRLMREARATLRELAES